MITFESKTCKGASGDGLGAGWLGTWGGTAPTGLAERKARKNTEGMVVFMLKYLTMISYQDKRKPAQRSLYLYYEGGGIVSLKGTRGTLEFSHFLVLFCFFFLKQISLE